MRFAENVKAFLLLLALVGFSRVTLAASDECAQAERPVSINVAFDYPGTEFSLHGSVTKDSERLQGYAKGFTGKEQIHSLTDADVVAGADSKSKFIAKLRNLSADHKVVNLNFVGHSLKLGAHESGWLLPGSLGEINREPYLNRCVRRMKSGEWSEKSKEASDKMCPNLVSKYVIKASELKAALAGKKIFGIMDTCYAEGFDLGEDSSMVYSSKKDQVSGNEDNSFTNVSGRLGCSIKVEKPTFNTLADYVGEGKIVYESGQKPVSKAKSWSKCYELAEFGKCTSTVPLVDIDLSPSLEPLKIEPEVPTAIK